MLLTDNDIAIFSNVKYQIKSLAEYKIILLNVLLNVTYFFNNPTQNSTEGRINPYHWQIYLNISIINKLAFWLFFLYEPLLQVPSLIFFPFREVSSKTGILNLFVSMDFVEPHQNDQVPAKLGTMHCALMNITLHSRYLSRVLNWMRFWHR